MGARDDREGEGRGGVGRLRQDQVGGCPRDTVGAGKLALVLGSGMRLAFWEGLKRLRITPARSSAATTNALRRLQPRRKRPSQSRNPPRSQRVDFGEGRLAQRAARVEREAARQGDAASVPELGALGGGRMNGGWMVGKARTEGGRCEGGWQMAGVEES